MIYTLPGRQVIVMASIVSLLAVVLLQVTDGAVYGDPSFLTTSQDLAVFEGDTVEIPCTIRNLPSNSPVFWLNGSQILSSARNVFASSNRRVTIEGQGDSFNLKIKEVREWDDGYYSCQVPMGQAIIQTSRLIVKKPPSIQTIHPGPVVRVRERDRLQLECRASGRPRPTITWTRQDRAVLPNGRSSDEGELLSFYNVRRNVSGVYVCKANNGVGSPANQSVTLIVMHSPIINVSSDIVYTGPSRSVSIECTVQAEPEATVAWYHNNSDYPIDFQRRKNFKTGKQKIADASFKHVLEISNLQARDLGIYRCEGRNDMGHAAKVITLSAHPFNLQIFSNRYSNYRDQYTLQWKVYSYSPVIEFILFLKQVNDSWSTPWIQSKIPASYGSQQSPHVQEHKLIGLVPNSLYLATMQARNAYGESEISEEFQFQTAAGVLSAVSQPLLVLFAGFLTVLNFL